MLQRSVCAILLTAASFSVWELYLPSHAFAQTKPRGKSTAAKASQAHPPKRPGRIADNARRTDSDASTEAESTAAEAAESSENAADDTPVIKTDREWKRLLTPKQYRVTRRKETELPYSGGYVHTKREGVYRCVCCGAELFSSQTKFESGTGWPSFYEPLRQKSIATAADLSDGTYRVEVTCARCAAHLGHVFSDGPEPTGLRYCINSASLKLKESSAKAPAEKTSPSRDKRRKR